MTAKAARCVAVLSWLGCGGNGPVSGATSPATSCKAITACGGDPTGGWGVTGDCEDAAPAKKSSDRCSQLMLDANGGLTMAVLGHGSMALASGEISYAADRTYTSQLEFASTSSGPSTTTEFPATCLTGPGQSPVTCDELATGLTTYLADPSAAALSYEVTPASAPSPSAAGLGSAPTYSNIACGSSAAGGCTCAYVTHLVVMDKGTWTTAGGVVTLASMTGGSGYVTDYCTTGPTLDLGAHGGGDLLGQPSLHTLVLQQQ